MPVLQPPGKYPLLCTPTAEADFSELCSLATAKTQATMPIAYFVQVELFNPYFALANLVG